jgi:hypothetical protein
MCKQREMFGYRPSLFRYIALRIYRQPWGRNTPNRSLHASSSEQSQHQDTYNILFFGRDEFSCIVFKELYAARGALNLLTSMRISDFMLLGL